MAVNGFSFTRALHRNLKLIIMCGLMLSLNMLAYLSWCMNQPVVDVCEKEIKSKEKEAFIVVLILTGPKNFERRDAVRETWLSNMPNDAIKYFAIGIKKLSEEEMGTLQYENSIHNDLLLLDDLEDSYYKLSEKVLQSFVWLDNHIDFNFVLKADDDSFARLDIVISELRLKEPGRFYWGFFDGRARVKRRGQWAEPNWILCDTYLPHALGGGYILSSDLVRFIASNARHWKIYNSEDVSVGTWLAPLEIQRIHDPRFDTEYRSRGCHNKYIVTHKQSITDMKNKQTNLKTTGKLCRTEYRERLSYQYNWNTYASQCCARNDSSVP